MTRSACAKYDATRSPLNGFDVKEALRIGLVHEVVPSAELQAAGERIVKQLLANGPDAVAQTKGCALRSTWSNVDERAFTGLIESHAAQRPNEAAEGFASFLEKRPGTLELGSTRQRSEHQDALA